MKQQDDLQLEGHVLVKGGKFGLQLPTADSLPVLRSKKLKKGPPIKTKCLNA